MQMELLPSTQVTAQWNGPVIPTGMKLLAEMMVAAPETTNKEAAAALGFNQSSIRLWKQTRLYQMYETFLIKQVMPELPPHVEAERRDALDRVKAKFVEHAETMQQRLLDLAETVDDPKMQMAIATDWLDRAGAAAPKANSGNTFNFHMSPEQLATIAAAFRESAIDAEVSVVGQP